MPECYKLFVLHPIKKVLRTTNKKKKTDNPIKKDLSGQLREPNTNSSSIIIYYQNTVKKKDYDL